MRVLIFRLSLVSLFILVFPNPAGAQTTANDYFQRGLAEQNKNNLTAALADYNRVLELDPNHALTCNNRGLIRQVQGDLNGALADYNRAIELDPKQVSA